MVARDYPNIARILAAKHSVLVLGPRGCGKTYYLSKLLASFPHTRCIDLLNSTLYRKYLLEPALLFDEIVALKPTLENPLYLMIDEVQLVPRLLSEVHRCIEQLKSRVVFILTGSSARKLKREEADLLAARAIIVPFFPFRSSEFDFAQHFSTLMQFGSLPDIVTTEDLWIRQEKLETYVGAYLNEEIKKESEVKNIEGFHRFLEIAASLNAEPVNYSKIARAAGVSPPTVREYFGMLVDTLIANEVPAWTNSIKKQLQQASKYYLFDNGVINALTGELAAPVRASTYRFGKLFENLVVNEIIRHRAVGRIKTRLFHFRSPQGHEIDLILQKNVSSQPVAVEIKSQTAPPLEDLRTLAAFKKEYPSAPCFVLCRTEEPYTRNGIHFEPYIKGIHKIFDSA